MERQYGGSEKWRNKMQGFKRKRTFSIVLKSNKSRPFKEGEFLNVKDCVDVFHAMNNKDLYEIIEIICFEKELTA